MFAFEKQCARIQTDGNLYDRAWRESGRRGAQTNGGRKPAIPRGAAELARYRAISIALSLPVPEQ